MADRRWEEFPAFCTRPTAISGVLVSGRSRREQKSTQNHGRMARNHGRMAKELLYDWLKMAEGLQAKHLRCL